jgi:hypothetical protein
MRLKLPFPEESAEHMFLKLATDAVVFGRQYRQQVLALAPMEPYAMGLSRMHLQTLTAVEV